jgi:hypothetical protein
MNKHLQMQQSPPKVPIVQSNFMDTVEKQRKIISEQQVKVIKTLKSARLPSKQIPQSNGLSKREQQLLSTLQTHQAKGKQKLQQT